MELRSILNQEIHCGCGRIHRADLKCADIGPGALRRLPETLRGQGFHKAYLVADVRTWKAAGEAAAAALSSAGFDHEAFVFPDEAPVPDETAVGSIVLHLPQDADLILGIGTGTINDLCKYVSHVRGLECAFLATAPSMDGFVSSGAALIVDHMKVTFNAQAPGIVIADTEILAKAPMEMITAGLGDMLGKYTCLLDWKLSHLITGEYYCEYIAGLVRTALQEILEQSGRIRERDPGVIGKITEALVLTGIAMKFAGSSRPASGCEHHMSHYWEMRFLMQKKKPVLHGTKVGVAAVAALRLYEMLADVLEGGETPGSPNAPAYSFHPEGCFSGPAPDPAADENESAEETGSAGKARSAEEAGSAGKAGSAEETDSAGKARSAEEAGSAGKAGSAEETDSAGKAGSAEEVMFPFGREAWETEIRAVFGAAANAILALEERARKNDPSARSRRLKVIHKSGKEIAQMIRSELPPAKEVERLLLSVDAPIHPAQIGVSLQEVRHAVLYAKEVRDRYTLLQLLWDLGLSRDFAASLETYYTPPGTVLPENRFPAVRSSWFLREHELLVSRLRRVRCFVLDMDGTIYLSNRLFPFTLPFLSRLNETGRSYCFFTNNSTKHQQDYLDKLTGMGIPVRKDQVFLSTQVIVEEMQRLHPKDTFFIVGTPNLVEAFRTAGLRVFDPAAPCAPGPAAGHPDSRPGGTASGQPDSRLGSTASGQPDSRPGGIAAGQPDSRPDVVILGFDITLTYEKISLACQYLRHGAAYYGVNMDYNCPVDVNGTLDYIPDCGSIAKLVERSTGRFPDFYGKPSRHALDYILRHTGFAEEELAVVGDRIYTDIAIANGTKVLSIMVLTGETQMADLEQYDYRPDFILPSLASLTEIL